MQVEQLELQGVSVLKVTGEVDLHSSPQLREAFRQYLDGKPPRLAVDMSHVNYIDSSGLAALIEYVRESQSFGGKLGLFGLRNHVLSIFRLVGLDRFFILDDTLEKVLEHLGN